MKHKHVSFDFYLCEDYEGFTPSIFDKFICVNRVLNCSGSDVESLVNTVFEYRGKKNSKKKVYMVNGVIGCLDIKAENPHEAVKKYLRFIAVELLKSNLFKC